MSGMRISDWFRGTAEVELFGAFPAGVLNAAAAEGLKLWDVESRDGNTLRLHTEEAGLAALARLAEKSACEIRILRRGGGRGARRRLLRRPALLLGTLLMAGLLPLSSLFVWDVRVQGTERLSRARVLRTLESLTGGTQQVRARGAVMAETWVERSALCPAREQLKTPAGIPRSRFALVLGKKRVNLYIGSGKTIDGCDKIITEYTLGLRGLFSTPLRLVRERFVPYETRPGDDYDPGRTGRQLYAELEKSTEGQILSHTLTPGRRGEVHVLTLRAHCLENIARPREYG